MKVGDYVRNQFGIAKIINIENNNGIDILTFDKDICYIVDKKMGEIKKERLFNKIPITKEIDLNKIKSSPNIIDLIEAGDYVNGMRVIDTSSSYYRLVFENTDRNRTIKSGLRNYYINHEGDIKTILTKEQFESIEYKVG